MRNFLIKATETVSYEMTFEAESHDEACEDWVGSDSELKEVGDREWHTESVEEIVEGIPNQSYDAVVEERDMIADENQKMAKFLKEIGYTANEIDNIATGWDDIH